MSLQQCARFQLGNLNVVLCAPSLTGQQRLDVPWWERVTPEPVKPLTQSCLGVWELTEPIISDPCNNRRLILKPALGAPAGRRVAGFYPAGKLDGRISVDGRQLQGQFVNDEGTHGTFQLSMIRSAKPAFQGTFLSSDNAARQQWLGTKLSELRDDELSSPI